MSGFDEVIHPVHRLQICSMLAAVESLEFSVLRNALGVSDSVLSKQVKVLQTAGYAEVMKVPMNSRTRTWLALTPAGREALAGHLAELRRIAALAQP
ncbi:MULTISPECIES: transcriptional regulator [unclassified Streptomyces]|uniref:transcriptional regulator n=1 Tax=unclassified Streptomyces TaxID=2593676 RepID=UPI0003759D09|nr:MULTISPECIES: transcriptional regulator [unclassified Streptomyces]MYQ77594.1 MarR family transcriptional regulator [Streptomyces sp. SID4923]